MKKTLRLKKFAFPLNSPVDPKDCFTDSSRKKCSISMLICTTCPIVFAFDTISVAAPILFWKVSSSHDNFS